MQLQELLSSYENNHLVHAIDQTTPKSSIRHLVDNLGAQTEVKSINDQKLTEYRSNQRRAGFANGTINKQLGTLSAAISWANKNTGLGFTVSIPRTKEEPRPVSLTASEVQRLIEAADDLRTKAFIALLFITGQRRTAVQALRSSQIRNGVIEFSSDDYENESRRKARARTPITPAITGIISELRASYGNTEYIIPGNGGFGRCKQLDRWFSAAAKKAGIVATPHVLRHSVATLAIEAGIPLQQVSQMLGHANTMITETIYVKRRPDNIKITTEKMGNMLCFETLAGSEGK